MSERLKVTLVTLTLLLASAASRAPADAPELSTDPAAVAVRQRLTTLLAGLPQGTSAGLVVVDADDSVAWFAHEGRRALKPASVIKLFVTAAALDRFGPDFAYQTRLYTRNDELLVVGSGDPGLGDDRIARRHDKPLHGEFADWARRLKARSVSTLEKIVLDDSVFDQQRRHQDWPEEQAQAWYQAPVGGINFNDNCLDVRLAVTDGRVELLLHPDLPARFCRNALWASAKHAPVVKRAYDEDVFEFRGPVAHDDELGPISVRRPTVFFGHALRRGLEERGVGLRGQVVRREITPAGLANAELLDVHVTTLHDVLWRCNTFSQNLFAECLLKSLAAYNPDGTRSGTPGSWESGLRVLQATLPKLGVGLDGAIFRDGSGLSHSNRVTAQQVVRLLVNMRRHPHRKLFIESLAQPGSPGTMQRRYATPALRDRLRGKTGTLSGVRALAGYVTRADGTTLAFALLTNGRTAQLLPVQVAEALVTANAGAPP